MQRLRGLTLSFLFSAIVTILALLLEFVLPELGLLLLRIAALFLLGVVVWTSLLDGTGSRGQLGFVHVLAAVTAVSWTAYAFTMEYEANTSGLGSSFITLLQNIFGLLVLMSVVEYWIRARKVSVKLNWVGDLAETARRLPAWILAGLIGLHALMTLYRFSLGLVMSGTGGVMSEVSMVGSIVLQLSEIVGGVVTVLGWLLALGAGISPRRKTLGWLIVLSQVALSFFGGRRVLLGLFLLGGLIWVGLRGITMRRAIVSLVVGVLLITAAGPLFLATRNQAINRGVNAVQPDARGAVVRESFSTAVDEFSLEKALSPDYVENVRHRSGFLEWTVVLQERIADGWDFRLGQILFESAMEQVPRFLWPGKMDYLGDLRIEQKMQLWFRLPLTDGASTTLAYAIADGGWLGVLVYFAAFGLILGILLRFMVTARFALSRLWAASTAFGLCFWIEEGVSPLFGAARYLVVIIILERLIGAGLGKRRRSTRVAPAVGSGFPRLERKGL